MSEYQVQSRLAELDMVEEVVAYRFGMVIRCAGKHPLPYHKQVPA